MTLLDPIGVLLNGNVGKLYVYPDGSSYFVWDARVYN
jgi:hypothetical protein